MKPLPTRRRFLVGTVAGAALAGCDRITVEVDPATLEPITPTEDFYVYQVFSIPDVDPDAWSLSFHIDGDQQGEIDLDGLLALDPVEIEHTLQCIGATPANQRINNSLWRAVPLDEVLDALGIAVPEEVVEIRFVGADDYDASIPVGDLERPLWLTTHQNGELLTPEHGAPARFLVPGRYGVKNVKWITEIHFLTEPYTDFWTDRGWAKEATYRTNGFIFRPVSGEEVSAGEPVTVLGTAFSGQVPIETVEIRVDNGDWTEAEIDYSPGPDVWTLWRFSFTPSKGTHDIQCRVTAADGSQSVLDPEGSARKKGYDGGMLVTVVAK